MSTSNNRDDFSPATKRLLAQRAGYICSYPGCNKLTIFPSEDQNKVLNNGVASHITAASSSGPRYDPNLTEAQRSDYSNGIWMCTEHSYLIDKDYSNYSTQLLKEWKKNHEEEIRERASLGIKLNDRLKSISIIDFGQLKGIHDFKLFTNTIFYSTEPIGKSMIFDILSGFFGMSHSKRWLKKYNIPVSIAKYLFTIDSKNIEYTFKLLDTNKSEFEINEKKVFKPSPKFCMIYLAQDGTRFSSDYKTDFFNWFNIKLDVIEGLIDYINTNIKIFIKSIKIENDNLEVMFNNLFIPYGMLSTSEKERLILEIGFQLAKRNSEEICTILVLDKTSFLTLDKNNLQNLIDHLTSVDNNFQSILLTNEMDSRIDYKNFIIEEIK